MLPGGRTIRGPADHSGQVALGGELELLQAALDEGVQDQPRGGRRDERDTDLSLEHERDLGVALDGLELVLAAEGPQGAAGLAEVDAVRRVQGGALDRLDGDPGEVPAVVHREGAAGSALQEVGGEPQAGHARGGVETAHQLEHLLDGRADDAPPLHLDGQR